MTNTEQTSEAHIPLQASFDLEDENQLRNNLSPQHMLPNRFSKETKESLGIRASSTDAGQTVVAGKNEDVKIQKMNRCCKGGV